MRPFHATPLVLAILLLLASSAWAAHHSGSVHVHGYTTRSGGGHYVAPYNRSAPHSSLKPTPGHEARSASRTTSLSSHPSTRTALGVRWPPSSSPRGNTSGDGPQPFRPGDPIELLPPPGGAPRAALACAIPCPSPVMKCPLLSTVCVAELVQ